MGAFITSHVRMGGVSSGFRLHFTHIEAYIAQISALPDGVTEADNCSSASWECNRDGLTYLPKSSHQMAHSCILVALIRSNSASNMK